MNTQVEPRHYSTESYDTKERFASYWYQIRETMHCRPRRVLEIGTGSGLVKNYLRSRMIPTVSLDVDRRLSPDMAATVVALPCRTCSFDVTLCCQVLEHLRYQEFLPALSELYRVTRACVVLSLPDTDTVYQFYVHIPKIGVLKRLIPLPRMKKPAHEFDGQHYWEIGKKEYPLQRILRDIRAAGFSIERTYRIFENAYHRFFILKKQTKADA